MAQGDVSVHVVDATDTAVDTIVTALRVTANDKYNLVPLNNSKKIAVIHTEEV